MRTKLTGTERMKFVINEDRKQRARATNEVSSSKEGSKWSLNGRTYSSGDVPSALLWWLSYLT